MYSQFLVDDFNLALGDRGLEHVYGYSSVYQINNNLENKGNILIEDYKVPLGANSYL